MFSASQTPYVCAFRGRRDSYQAAIALEQQGLLDTLVTDFYAYKWMRNFSGLLPRGSAEKLMGRHAPEISDRHVRTLPGMLFSENIRRTFGTPLSLLRAQASSQVSWAAAKAARKNRTNLFLYHSYAWEAFSAPYPHQPKRVLFQYHPYFDYESSIYDQDDHAFPGYEGQTSASALATLPAPLLHGLRNAWRHADYIICASTFTKHSLLWAGADEKKCRVVPYGNDKQAKATDVVPGRDCFQALFVGTGGTRKGLHHLLLAWQRVRLAGRKKLVLVCRDISPELRTLLERTPDVQLLPGVPGGELAQLYSTSHLFVMPSLVEGFGQVYLEALTYGCPVLGTANTALPDLGGESDGIFLAAPGNIEGLTERLEVLGERLMDKSELRLAAQSCAEARSWKRFRSELIVALGES